MKRGIQRPASAASPTAPWDPKFVSVESLPKTGVSAVWAGDFWEILAKIADYWSLETGRKPTKTPQNAGLSRPE
jgi:hypothetical protein